ncbi:phage tail spike protein [Blautia pseudococcoides]|uniref:phage tail spike protein n=1 Tax=Blautia pseudococcoides TaxID=1796616 RepID=UPI00148AEE6B|nr:phage tail spike protein [Blautia pseudococcoides]QJU14780.1 hypothetical protein HL650_10130 [Blautia pseudococcoides]
MKIYEASDSSIMYPLNLPGNAWSICHKYDGRDELTFELSPDHETYKHIAEEVRITDGNNIYVVKNVDEHSGTVVVDCNLDLDAWKERFWKEYRRTNALLIEVLDEIKPAGWTILGAGVFTQRDTVEASEETPMECVVSLDILTRACDIYGAVINYDIPGKKAYVINPESYTDSGEYFTDELNLRSLGFTGNSADFATRLYAYGKKDDDGNPLTFAAINGGKEYVEDKTYSNRTVSIGWSDERYTVTSSLMQAAKEKLKTLAYPVRSYECDVRNFKADMWLYKMVTLIDRRRRVHIKHRVVEYREYPKRHDLDVVTISATAPRIEATIRQVKDEIKSQGQQQKNFMEQAIDRATESITGTKGGNVRLNYDAEHNPFELLVMDTKDINTSKNLWRFNLGGLGHSKNGYNGPYELALTADGQINASLITVGELNGGIIKAGSIQAETLSSEYRRSVEKYSEDKATAALDNSKKYTDGKLELYSTTEEVRTAIIQSADDIKLEAEQKYTTTMYVTQALSDAKSEAIQAGKNAASTAESNANKSTDEKLKLYSTTEEMRSAIDVSAQGIKLEASKIYTTFDYVGTVTEDAKDSAVKAGQEAANKAEANATKAGEEAAYQALVDARAAILLASNEISASVKRLEQDTKHDYVTNGDFSNGLTNWEVNNNTAVTVVNDAVLGKCVKFTGDTSAYLRFTVKNIKAGKYKVRFKAAGKAGSASEARIHCRFGSSQYTDPGGISTSWTQFEYEFEIPSDNSWYMYLYDVASNIPVYIKDVEILGNYEQYNEARISIMSDKIESRVSKDDFSSYVTQYYDRVITAFNNSSKYVQISPGEIAIYDGAVSSSKKRSAFDAEGNHFWRDGYYVGKIGTNNLKTNSAYKGLVFDLEPQGKFMSWGYRDKFSDDFYTMMLYFFPQANVSGNAYAGLYLGHDLYTNGYTISIDANGRTWTKGYEAGAAIRTKDTFWIEGGSGDSIAQFRSSDVVIVKDLYANLVGEPSDERLKDNITDSTVDALQIITSLQMRAFDWIETDVHEDVGLIAQEVEEIAPELVSENNGIKHINPTRLLWYCVKAIQQLSGELPRTALMKSDEGMTLDEKKAWIAAIRESQKPVEREPIEFTLPVQ